MQLFPGDLDNVLGASSSLMSRPHYVPANPDDVASIHRQIDAYLRESVAQHGNEKITARQGPLDLDGLKSIAQYLVDQAGGESETSSRIDAIIRTGLEKLDSRPRWRTRTVILLTGFIVALVSLGIHFGLEFYLPVDNASATTVSEENSSEEQSGETDQELDRIRAELESSEGSLAEVRQANSELSSERDSLAERLAELTSELKLLKQTETENEQRYNALATEKSALEKSQEQLSSDIAAIGVENSQLMKQAQAERLKVEQLSKEKAKLDELVASLREQVSSLEDSPEPSQGKVAKLEKRLAYYIKLTQLAHQLMTEANPSKRVLLKAEWQELTQNPPKEVRESS